jgi:hypothetical protein
VHLALANMCVGAKHDRNQYGMITNNLDAVMLRPLQKPDAPVQRTMTDENIGYYRIPMDSFF